MLICQCGIGTNSKQRILLFQASRQQRMNFLFEQTQLRFWKMIPQGACSFRFSCYFGWKAPPFQTQGTDRTRPGKGAWLLSGLQRGRAEVNNRLARVIGTLPWGNQQHQWDQGGRRRRFLRWNVSSRTKQKKGAAVHGETNQKFILIIQIKIMIFYLVY